MLYRMLELIVAGSLIYLLGTYLVVSGALVIHFIGGRRDRRKQTEDLASLAVSRFTIPVSVLVPAFNEEHLIVACVQSLLESNYPEFEVIVVSDGSADATMDRLRAAFDMKPREVFYRRVLATQPVRRIFRSVRDARLTVVEKVHGGKADALNCAVNLARYRYVCCVAADTVYEREALLHAMPEAIQDPAAVIGISSHVDVTIHPDSHEPGQDVDRHVLSNFQHLERLRWLLNNRLVWSRLDFRLGASRAFAIWRRDALLEVDGFATDLTGDEIDVSFRMQQRFAKQDRPGRVVALATLAGRTEASDRMGGLIRQRARWQRVVWESAWRYRHMFANRRYGRVGSIGFPYFAVSQIFSPFVQMAAMVAWPLAWWTGVLSGTEFLRLLAIVAFGSGIVTSAAILLQESHFRTHSLMSLARLIFLGPLEPFLYRPAILFARLRGAWGFLRGDRDWDRVERNPPVRAS